MKLFNLSEENEEIFQDALEDAGLHNYMQLKTMGKNKQKELIKITRNNEVSRFAGNLPDDLINIVVYEEAFDKLDLEEKKLLAKDTMLGISYDDEKEKILIGVPQVIVTVAGRHNEGDKLIDAAEKGVMAIMEVEAERQRLKEEIKEKKAAERAAKKNNR